MVVYLVKQRDDILHLVGGHHGMKQVHVFFAVASDGIHTGYAVPEGLYVSVRDLRTFGGGNLHRHPLIAVMERRHNHRGHKLEQDGVPRVIPAENGTKDAQKHHVSGKYIAPDGIPGLIGYVKGNEVRSACGRIAS